MVSTHLKEKAELEIFPNFPGRTFPTVFQADHLPCLKITQDAEHRPSQKERIVFPLSTHHFSVVNSPLVLRNLAIQTEQSILLIRTSQCPSIQYPKAASGRRSCDFLNVDWWRGIVQESNLGKENCLKGFMKVQMSCEHCMYSF